MWTNELDNNDLVDQVQRFDGITFFDCFHLILIPVRIQLDRTGTY